MNAVQFPPDPTSANTGQSGILALNDPAPTAPVLAASQATLGSNGPATFVQDGDQMRAFASLTNLTNTNTLFVVASSVGNEVVPCTLSGTSATCSGILYGTPIVGSPVDLANNGKLAAQGKTVQTTAMVATNITLDTPATVAASTYNATVVGSGLTAPGSGAQIVANNWQTGVTGPHSLPAGTPKGTWTITGVRVHAEPNNHGKFRQHVDDVDRDVVIEFD